MARLKLYLARLKLAFEKYEYDDEEVDVGRWSLSDAVTVVTVTKGD